LTKELKIYNILSYILSVSFYPPIHLLDRV